MTRTDDGAGRVIQGWHKDGSVNTHGQRRRQFSPTTNLNHRQIQWHCGNIQAKLGSCSGITAGPGFIQFGDWRLAAFSYDYFSISHRSRNTAWRFKWDGTHWATAHQHHNGWDEHESGYVPAGDVQEVKIGDRFIEFGKFWRLGEVSKDKLSISHKSGHTAYVWQKNGHVLGGPRTDNNLFNRLTTTEPTGVTFGDRFVQIGHFRIGDVDGWHFSISHVNSGLTAQIFTGDGHVHNGNGHRRDWQTTGRPLQDCKIFPEKPHLFSFDTLYAFYSPVHKRYLQLTNGADMASVKVDSGPSDLPYWRAFERFSVVDAGNGLVALHNARNNRFMKMSHGDMTASPIKPANRLPASGWYSEYFQIVDAGDGMVGLHNPYFNRFVQMHSNGHVQATGGRNARDLKHNKGWTFERFYMVPVKNYLQPGAWVGLFNPTAKRFLQMHGSGIGCSGQFHFFAVLQTSVELPNGWADATAFVPVPINTNMNEIALWHPGHSRAVRMDSNGHVGVRGHVHAQVRNLTGSKGGSPLVHLRRTAYAADMKSTAVKSAYAPNLASSANYAMSSPTTFASSMSEEQRTALVKILQAAIVQPQLAVPGGLLLLRLHYDGQHEESKKESSDSSSSVPDVTDHELDGMLADRTKASNDLSAVQHSRWHWEADGSKWWRSWFIAPRVELLVEQPSHNTVAFYPPSVGGTAFLFATTSNDGEGWNRDRGWSRNGWWEKPTANNIGGGRPGWAWSRRNRAEASSSGGWRAHGARPEWKISASGQNRRQRQKPSRTTTRKKTRKLWPVLKYECPSRGADLPLQVGRQGCATRTFGIVAAFLIGKDKGAQTENWVYMRPPPEWRHLRGIVVVHHIDDGRCAGDAAILDRLLDGALCAHCEITPGPLEAEVEVLGKTKTRRRRLQNGARLPAVPQRDYIGGGLGRSPSAFTAANTTWCSGSPVGAGGTALE
ncbi:unnamed protein product, partial [Symbiodinium sp. KB8]